MLVEYEGAAIPEKLWRRWEPALWRGLSHPTPDVRIRAIELLTSERSRHPDLEPRLSQELSTLARDDRDANVRRIAGAYGRP